MATPTGRDSGTRPDHGSPVLGGLPATEDRLLADLSARVEVSAATRLRSRILEFLATLVGLFAVVTGAQPLLVGSAADASQPGLAEAVSELVSPSIPPPPRLERDERTDPLAVLGRDLRAAMGRYEAMATMFGQHRLSCELLREAYVEVSDGWTAYSVGLARHRRALSTGLAYRDETLYRDVRRVDADFTASGCSRP